MMGRGVPWPARGRSPPVCCLLGFVVLLCLLYRPVHDDIISIVPTVHLSAASCFFFGDINSFFIVSLFWLLPSQFPHFQKSSLPWTFHHSQSCSWTFYCNLCFVMMWTFYWRLGLFLIIDVFCFNQMSFRSVAVSSTSWSPNVIRQKMTWHSH